MQPILNDYRQLYHDYTEILLLVGESTNIFDEDQPAVNTLDPSENPNLVRRGNYSMTYNLQSDLNNFDKILLSNAVADSAANN